LHHRSIWVPRRADADLRTDRFHPCVPSAATPGVSKRTRSRPGSGCGSPILDGWRWPDDGRWACQLRQDAQRGDSKAVGPSKSPARPRAQRRRCHGRGPRRGYGRTARLPDRRVFLRDMGGRRAPFQPLKPLGAGLADALGAPTRWSHAVLDYVGAVVADTAENCSASCPPLRRVRVEGHSAARGPHLDEVPPRWQAPLVPIPRLVERKVLWAVRRRVKPPRRMRG
jgi:hypothetical protein